MIWQCITKEDKQELVAKYNDIRNRLLKLKGNRVHYTKEDYDIKVLKLQKLYETLNVQYLCDFCGNVINLNLTKIKNLIKGIKDPIFCNRSCSGSYYAYKSHDISNEEWLKRRLKISKTLKEKGVYLKEEAIMKKLAGTQRYWYSKTPEERSMINKEKVPKIKQTKFQRYRNENYNNRYQISNTWQNKSEEEKREIALKTSNTICRYQASDGTILDSSYELDFYEYYVYRHIVIRRNIPVKYKLNNKIKVTLIDFKIDNMLFECKSYWVMKQDLELSKRKLEVYKENNVILVTDNRGLEYCKENKIDLTVLTIDLFRNNMSLNEMRHIIDNGGMCK